MDRPYLIDKPIGATPLQALQMLRRKRNFSENIKLSYAGRLDPLASGLLPVLYGSQLSHQEDYWYLPKQYRASIVLGISTDSYDLLGLPSQPRSLPIAPERITSVIRGLVGKLYLGVPVYSSVRHEGRALFAWARTEEDGPPSIPVRRMSVSQIDVVGLYEIPGAELLSRIQNRVSTVVGDFRQQEILSVWHATPVSEYVWQTVVIDIHCGSGTYIRSLAQEIGRRLQCGAVVEDLRRTRVGPWSVDDEDVTKLSWPQSGF